jgi:hypothetical protein
MSAFEKLLAALEAHGCEPRQIGPGLWLAICPACRAQGRFELLEVNASADTPVRCGTGAAP